MRIQMIKANNFKSLVDFRIDLAKYNCLIGLNGSGKSTVLQFIDFLAQQVRGDIKGWLAEWHWKPTEINSRISAKKNIDFHAELVASEGRGGAWWEASFNTKQLHCTSETVKTCDARLEVRNGQLRIVELNQGEPNREVLDEKISFSYEGSVLSQLRDSALPSSLVAFKNYFASIKSLDLLSPEYLRQRTRESPGSLGLGGQRLSAFLHELGSEKKQMDIGVCKENSPNSLKGELAQILGGLPSREDLCDMVNDQTIDFDRIDMPSAAAFRKTLQKALQSELNKSIRWILKLKTAPLSQRREPLKN